MSDISFAISLDIQFWHWLILAGALAAIEILTPGFFFIWLSGAALVTGLVVLVARDLGWEIQVLVFAVLSGVSVLGWYKIGRRFKTKTDDATLNRRGEQLIGRTATLSESIVNGRGQIRLDDTVWRCEGSDIGAGQRVRIVSVRGATLLVEKA